MKAELIIYKVLSFLLLPIAALLGLNCIAGIVPALSNPVILLVVFLFACIVIYIVASYIFLTRGIDKNSVRKPVLKDWIRINGMITFLLCLLVLPSLTTIQLQPSDAKMIMEQMEAQNHMKLGITVPQFQVLLNGFITFIIVLSIVLIVHITMTFRLMRRFSYLFGSENTDIK